MSRENVKRGDYILGIDLGSNSVGFAAISAHDPASPVPVEELEVFQIGSHVFEEAGADNVSKGVRELNNHVRQKARRARITYRRWKWRKERLYEIFTELGVLPEDPFERDRILCIHKDEGLEKDPLTLRVRGLDEELDPVDFAKALCHLNRRRGYLSTRDLQTREIPQGMLEEARRAYLDVPDTSEDDVPAKAEGDEEDKRVVLGGIQRARKALVKNEARTFGELLHKAHAQGSYTRHYTERFKKKSKEKEKAKLAPEEKQLKYRADRAMIEAEFDLLWERQSKARPELWTPARRDEIHQIIFYQYELGPSDHLRKACMFYPSKKCAPRASRAFQEFRIVQDLVSYIFVGEKKKKKGETGERTVLPEETLRAMLAVLASGYDIAVDEKDRDLPNVRGCLADYIKVPHDLVKRSKFHKYRIIHGSPTIRLMRQGSKGQWDAWSEELREHVLDVLTSAQTPSGAYKALVKRGIEPQIAANLAMAPLPEGYGEYSTKALKEMTRRMIEHGLQQKVVFDKMLAESTEKRLTYYKAPEVSDSPSGGEFGNLIRLRGRPRGRHEDQKADSDLNLRNPIVEKALRRAVDVINQLIHRYGKTGEQPGKGAQYRLPKIVRIELPRELTLPPDAKKKIEDRMNENEARKLHLEREIRLAGHDPKVGSNLLKAWLLMESNFELLYEGGKASFNDLPGLEIDHAIPRSELYVNERFNLVVCWKDTNTRKGNRLPLKFLEEDLGETAAAAYKRRVLSSKLSSHKKSWLLKTEVPDDFLASQLHATSYLARELKRLLEENGLKVEVTAGRGTAHLRHLWGLEKDLFPDWLAVAKAAKAKDQEEGGRTKKKTFAKNRSDHRHHAVDALVVALTDVSTFQALSRLHSQKVFGSREERARANAETCPVRGLRQWLETNRDNIPVTSYVRKKTTGSMNRATAMGPKESGLQGEFLEGSPLQSARVGNKLVKFDKRGKAAQVYELGNNHHLQVYVTPPDKNGKTRLEPQIVTLHEISERISARTDPYAPDRERLAQGYRLAHIFEKGEVVEFADRPGQFYRIASISAENTFEMKFQLMSVATMAPELRNFVVGEKVPIIRMSSVQSIALLQRRVNLNIFGEVVREEVLSWE